MASSAHLLCSAGARRHPGSQLDRYSTTTELSHGRDDYAPRPSPRQRGTGWSANFRPGVYYGKNLDKLDNPKLGVGLADSQFHSRTRKDFLAAVDDDGRTVLPQDVHMVKSGFVREVPRTLPTQREVSEHYVAKKEVGKVIVSPKRKSLLATLTPRDPVANENAGHGPSFMSTEVQHNFTGQLTERMNVSQRDVGYKTGSGWSHSINREPITQRPEDPFTPIELPVNNRPIGLSLATVDFKAGPILSGQEDLPLTSPRAQPETGYTRWVDTRSNLQHRRVRSAYTPISILPARVAARVEKTDPAEFANCVTANNSTSFTSNSFVPPRLARSAPPKLGRTSIGFKELTGFQENHEQYFVPADRLEDYVSHYSIRHKDKNPTGRQRQGHTRGDVMLQKADGFSKSTIVHHWGADRSPAKEVEQLHPYVAKSLLRRDPLYVGSRHSHKEH